jgi:hypothetical protein
MPRVSVFPDGFLLCCPGALRSCFLNSLSALRWSLFSAGRSDTREDDVDSEFAAPADGIGRGVTVAVSRRGEGGVARWTGVAVARAVATGVWRNCGVAFTLGVDGPSSRTGLAAAVGLAGRDGPVGETVAAAAGILGDEADGTCRDDAVGRAKGACVGDAAGDSDAGLGIGGEVSAVACVGLTKVFGGASGGGVDSDLIFVRAFSTAC